MRKLLFIIILFQLNLTAQSLAFRDQYRKLEISQTPIPKSLPYFSPVIDSDIILKSALATEIDYTKLSIIGGVTLLGGVSVQVYQANAWWSSGRRSFHFVEDLDYALLIDKTGHFYATAILAYGFSVGLNGSGVDPENSAIYGSVLAMAWQTFVEINDGFGAQWGFSKTDYYSDILGAGFQLGRYYFPFLKNFHPKMSYIPTDKLKDGKTRAIVIDDYEGQKYWMGIRVKELLPKSIDKYWPSILMLSVGMGVQLSDPNNRRRDLYIAFDIDTEQIPLYGPVWSFVKNSLNWLHFPMPGIRVTNGVTFFGFVY
ncbi:MAG: YfiM family protein [Melioribacteraceae bacterium]|nr:YfiM family protein [Melioribacteraceae bacterium]MCF8264333.1 YfiM family protein [Melioribacteraceae bacterium]MCF8412008.1 YfiM family protein [Melioribacteraceae bacterium]MCF8431459.1 YfiM family protein [Melioribacteraceae bacterium]